MIVEKKCSDVMTKDLTCCLADDTVDSAAQSLRNQPGEQETMTPEDYGTAFKQGFSRTVRFLISRGADPELAEETAQAAWTRGWARRRQLRDPNCVGTWVNSIAMNLFRNSYRTARRTQALTELPAPATSALDGLDAGKVLDCCRQKDRSLLQLHYVYGYTTGEIGNRLGLTSTAVRVRLLRARRTLQKRLNIVVSRPALPDVETGAHRCSQDDGTATLLGRHALANGQ